MKRTKRWLLIFAALSSLTMYVEAVRATSLIFGKISTTSTTTTDASSSVEKDETTEASSIATIATNENSTKPLLTGIPQIDYIWDPNLPRELNGYNLSDYPFYNSVPPPEEIDFKCDGLHDGFYASVKHKCQLYHHCLFGIRYDFLCANFTAFDQKTFICHFVSEVDCKNSPKYYHRNDALYEAATSSSTTTTPTPPPTAAPVPILPVSDVDRLRAGRPHRRPPLRRRRPQVDYYYYDDDYDDDYYDDRITRRRKQRPRVRRPEYDDDYDDRRIYRDDERYDKRQYSRDRMPDDIDDYEYDRRKSDRSRNRNRPNESRQTSDDDRLDRRNPTVERRRPMNDRRLNMGERRYFNDDRRSFNEDRRYSLDRGKSQGSEELDEERRPLNGRRRLNGDRRPTFSDDIDRSHRRDQDDNVHSGKKEEKVEQKSEEKILVRPTGSGSSSSLSSLFERPRTAPKVARPVPSTEKKKYEYATKTSTTTPQPLPPASYEEYYDEYEDPALKITSKEEKRPQEPHTYRERDIIKPIISPGSIREDPRNRYETIRNSESVEQSRERHIQNSRYRQIMRDRSRYNSKSEEPSDEEGMKLRQSQTERYMSRHSPSSRFDLEKMDSRQEKDKENERQKELLKPSPQTSEERENSKPLPSSNEEYERIESEEETIKDTRPIVRIVKRPYLQSRGNNPYLPKGLVTTGIAYKSQENTTPKTTTASTITPTTTITKTTESIPYDMGSTISGVRLLEHGAPIVRGNPSDMDYPSPHKGPRTTQKPQIDPPRSALDDIYENEYDVTLNDALNPTLKPLTSNRGPPTGFSYIGKYDRDRYTFNGPHLNNDSLYSSTAVRNSAIQSPSSSSSSSYSRTNPSQLSRESHLYYDDYEY